MYQFKLVYTHYALYVVTTICTCYSVIVCYDVCYYVDVLLLQRVDCSTLCLWDGHVEVVRHLINNNADISTTDNVSDCSMFIV